MFFLLEELKTSLKVVVLPRLILLILSSVAVGVVIRGSATLGDAENMGQEE
jgi:hypothetical protein